ncbi:phytoene synthase [Streptoalloteichus tenebrarius]|uniref:Phytoene synthase n=1 Tax=Streptoalloteichus tenebrarius (strain ATCC 17920 / DSM 40477 / JCM 4838 / CBS 697.72 / NBRC 16177 / NCIMB 11028 / NRRL B-12390 / A12253. 1 / ISP 5477) TaxID=1933 RepID=A0ABT1HQF2_STRSD|nr:squalene/phytoene synthase family protein [Streptoalloteichus tenebrarius]MCP2257751.1 phytoene synthase [Streptoalloteichus tenebrarius]
MVRRCLDAAGLRDPRLRSAYAECFRTGRERAGGYHALLFWLPPAKRPYYSALGAFITYTDDILDDLGSGVDERAERYDRWLRRLGAVLAGEPAEPARSAHERRGELVARAWAHTMRTWDIPGDAVTATLRAWSTDLGATEFATYGEFERYVHAVATSTAAWANVILEPRSEEAERLLAPITVALQLVDCVHDLVEDLALGRLYLPLEDLYRFDLERIDLERAARQGRCSPEVRQLFRFQAARARRLFEQGWGYWDHLHPTSREFPRLFTRLALLVLDEWEHVDFDVFAPPHWRDTALRVRVIVRSYVRAVWSWRASPLGPRASAATGP